MAYFQTHAGQIFPFDLGCSQIILWENCGIQFGPTKGPVQVTACDSTSFTFTAREGHYDLPGSTIRFSTYEMNGDIYLRQQASWVTNNPLDWLKAAAAVPLIWHLWGQMADNLRNALAPGLYAQAPVPG
jgi:hypothetical protein